MASSHEQFGRVPSDFKAGEPTMRTDGLARSKRTVVWIFLVLLSLVLGSRSAVSEWIDASGRPVPDSDSMRSAGDFAAALILTPDEKEFRRIWAQPTTPQVRSTSKTRLGSSVSAMIVFHGCAANSKGRCDVQTQFTLVAPDGTRSEAGSGPTWTAAPMPPRILQIGQVSVTIGFDSSDTPGRYEIRATVSDRVANRSVDLSVPLEVSK